MHARIIPVIRDFEISFSGICAAVKSSGRIDLEFNKFCLTRKFQSLTKTPNFDEFSPCFEICSAVAFVHMRSGFDCRGSTNARPGTARLGSNAALVSKGEQDDVLFAPGVTLMYQPRITNTFYAQVGVIQQFFLYDRLTELNFANLDVIAGFVYYLPQFHKLSLRGYYDYNRETDTDNFDEIFVNHSIILNAELPFRIARAQQIFLGLNLNLSFYGNPESPRRNNYSLYANYDLALSRSFSLDAAFQFVVRDYYSGDRTDVNEILAVSANYRVRDWLTLSALSSFAWNQSNHSVFDYSVANIGGGVALTLKF